MNLTNRSRFGMIEFGSQVHGPEHTMKWVPVCKRESRGDH